jgi:hypothetical protein
MSTAQNLESILHKSDEQAAALMRVSVHAPSGRTMEMRQS